MTLVHYNRSEESNEEILDRYTRALAQMKAWGVRVSSESRLSKYRDNLARLIPLQGSPVTQDVFHKWQFDMREIDEVIAIVESLDDPPRPAALERLGAMCGGSVHPDEGPLSPSRDLQWELYLRALLVKAEIQVVFGEPDLLATVDGQSIPIEAKRPKSEARLDDRIRKAVSQISATRSPGVVALSVDRVLSEGLGVLSGPSLELLEHDVSRRVKDLTDRNLKTIAKRVAGHPVVGIIFHARIPALVSANDHPRLISAARVVPIRADPMTDRVLSSLLEGLSRS